MTYRYYSTKGLIMKEMYPTLNPNKIIKVYNFKQPVYVSGIHTYAYGYIDYAAPLGYDQVMEYEFVPFKIQSLHLTYLGRDSWGRYVYQDEKGTIWKHLNCLATREKCIENGDALYSSVDGSFDGEPDCHMASHIEVVFLDQKSEEFASYDIVLLMKEGADGLSQFEINKMMAKIAPKSVYPIELEAYSAECSAMGFITAETANKLDYDYEKSGLHDFIASILDDVNQEYENGIYDCELLGNKLPSFLLQPPLPDNAEKH